VNWLSKEFLLAVCGALLIALIAVSWSRPLIQGSSPKPAESAQRPAQANQDSYGAKQSGFRSYINLTSGYCTSERPNAQSEWRKNFICESKVTDVIIAGLTLFLMIFTGLLVWVGYRQEKTTRRQMRAFVYVDTVSLYNIAHPINPLPSYKPTGAQILSPTEGPLAIIGVKNTGNTPAYKVRHFGAITVGPFPLVGNLPAIIEGADAPYSSLPPGGITTKMIKFPPPLTPAQIAGIRDQTTAIWVHGIIRYRDVFRRKRTTEYRLFHNAITGTTGVSTEMSWGEGGNDAT
jgi:hypothetical protein